jgi:hypothetical protein
MPGGTSDGTPRKVGLGGASTAHRPNRVTGASADCRPPRHDQASAPSDVSHGVPRRRTTVAKKSDEKARMILPTERHRSVG